eukprot:maker-scaffold755_size101758-snap-gene-0.21 protein:Tk12405 transcript:maker-scaffold755_size101758-snap-gene-0.21-mRNA-1 annotation:"PREDICTED: hypothetical protein LOC100743083"
MDCRSREFLFFALVQLCILSSNARPFFDCLFRNEESFITHEPKFKLASVHYHRPVMQISQNRSIVFHNSSESYFFYHMRHHQLDVEWFTICHSNKSVRQLVTNDTFHVCQAGYPERKLVFDRILRQIFVLEPESHHEIIEAVVYERHWSQVEHRLYLRPQHHKRRVVTVQFSEIDPFSMGQEAMDSTISAHSEVIRPHNIRDIWAAEMAITSYSH